jgi:hypothetical protein
MAKTLSAVNPIAYDFGDTKSPVVKVSGNKVNDIPSSFRLVKSESSFIVPPSDGVRIVTAAEYKEAAACLAEAFSEDDVVRYFVDVPDRKHWTTEQKWALHVEILEYITYAHILKGLVTTIGDFEAVSLW